MKAAYLTAIRTVEIRDVPEPKLERDQDVLLRVEAVGVCGSDMHYYRTGRIGDQVVDFPWRVGHEMGGMVEAVGAGVQGLEPGQRVALDPLIWCGRCDQCLGGRRHTCRKQRFLGCPGQEPGCLAERIVMPAASCVPVPNSISAVQAAIAEPLAIGVYAVRLSGAGPNTPVAILGAGPIGLCVLRACLAAGVRSAYLTEIRDYRAEMAASLGAKWTGNAQREDVVAEIVRHEPNGLPVVFECAGEQATLDDALALARPGGKVMIVGIPPDDRVSFDVSTLRRHEVTLQPVRRQNNTTDAAIELVATDAAVGRMVTHEYPLDGTQEAFDTVADYRDGVVKAMIHLAGSA